MSTGAALPKPVVLVVDDENLIRWSLKERLVRADYAILEAETGLEALAVFAENRVDLVLLDLCLPELDGLGVLERIKKERPACPVILMTAYGSPDSTERALALGASRVVTKPFDFDLVLGLVRSALPSLGDVPLPRV